jgi:hypothetical protein
LKRFLVVLLIAGQVAGIVAGRFRSERFFCWAPFEETSFYEIEAKVDGKKLDAAAIKNRFGLGTKGRDNRSIHNIISVLRWCEQHSDNPAEVKLIFQTNGGNTQIWQWPDDQIY